MKFEELLFFFFFLTTTQTEKAHKKTLVILFSLTPVNSLSTLIKRNKNKKNRNKRRPHKRLFTTDPAWRKYGFINGNEREKVIKPSRPRNGSDGKHCQWFLYSSDYGLTVTPPTLDSRTTDLC